MIETREILHAHMCCSIGAGAKGFNMGSARVGNMRAKFRCIGGIDVVPSVLRDFKRLTGAEGTLLDLFTLEQYIHMPQARDEPVWMGWYDSEQAAWFDVSGAERDEGEVTKWAHMPTGEATA